MALADSNAVYLLECTEKWTQKLKQIIGKILNNLEENERFQVYACDCAYLWKT